LREEVDYSYGPFGEMLSTYTSVPGSTTSSHYAYDGFDPAKASAPGASGWDVLADLDSSNSLVTR
jgi:hypothetical protein